MTEVVFHVSGDQQVVAQFDEMAERAVDVTPVWDQVAAEFVELEAATFASQGGASGAWRPLSPAYAEWKAQHYPGATILRATDRLFHSLTDELDIDIRLPHMVVLGTDDPKAGFHQHSTSKMPARPVIDLGEQVFAGWASLVSVYLAGVEELAA